MNRDRIIESIAMVIFVTVIAVSCKKNDDVAKTTGKIDARSDTGDRISKKTETIEGNTYLTEYTYDGENRLKTKVRKLNGVITSRHTYTYFPEEIRIKNTAVKSGVETELVGNKYTLNDMEQIIEDSSLNQEKVYTTTYLNNKVHYSKNDDGKVDTYRESKYRYNESDNSLNSIDNFVCNRATMECKIESIASFAYSDMFGIPPQVDDSFRQYGAFNFSKVNALPTEYTISYFEDGDKEKEIERYITSLIYRINEKKVTQISYSTRGSFFKEGKEITKDENGNPLVYENDNSVVKYTWQ